MRAFECQEKRTPKQLCSAWQRLAGTPRHELERIQSDPRFDALFVEQRRLLHEQCQIAPAGWVAMLCSLAKLHCRMPGNTLVGNLVRTTQRRIGRHVAELTAQGIANTAWAMAKVDRAADAKLFDQLAAAAGRLVHTFNAQNVANTAWAFAKVGRTGDAKLFDQLAAAAGRLVHTFNAQDVANTAWAFAKVGRAGDAKLFDQLAAAAGRLVRTFNAQNVANTAWAFAKVGRTGDAKLFGQLAAAARRLVRKFNAQNVANTAWAFAKVGRTGDAKLFGQLAAAARRLVRKFNAQGIASTAWAFAKVGRTGDAELFDQLAAAAGRLVHTFNAQDVANTAWAFCVVAIYPPAFFGKVVRIVDSWVANKQGELRPEHRSMLHQVALALKYDSGLTLNFSTPVRKALHSAFVARSRAGATGSAFQRQVCAATRRLAMVLGDEVVLPLTGYSVDVLLSHRVVVEVDGPVHFCSGKDRRPKGATLLKRRLLARAGWRVVSVPYWEWGQIRHDTGKACYLTRKIEAACSAGAYCANL